VRKLHELRVAVRGCAVECEVGDLVCKCRELWALLQPHLQWIGFVFGAAMAIWRWWDGREAVLYQRVNRRLQERGLEISAACRHSLELILRPSPGARPKQPLFIAPTLRYLFIRETWRPLFAMFDPLSTASGKLSEAHATLAKKYRTLRHQKAFVAEQRFSAFLLQGAIAAARAGEANGDAERSKRDREALERFEAALRVEGKGSDLAGLEVRGLQLRKVGRKQDALEVFQRVEKLLEGLLSGATLLDEKSQFEYELQRIRNARYIGEIHHETGANGRANDALLPLSNGRSQVQTQWLDGRNRLERGHFHEVHGCVRVRLAMGMGAQNPAGGVADNSISAAQEDYDELIQQLDPRRRRWMVRFWRWVWQSDRSDGSAALRKLAGEGVKRLERIKQGNGCPVCSSDETLRLIG
jgi:hypothetical protein